MATTCTDIFIKNTTSRSCAVTDTTNYTSLISSINCWIADGQIDLTSANDGIEFKDNGNGTGTIVVDGVDLATVITTATDVQLTDNGDGTSKLFVDGVDLGAVQNAMPNLPTTLTNLQNGIDNNAAGIDALELNSHIDDDVETVTGVGVDNTDARNPVINIPQNVSDLTNDLGFITTETDDQTASEVAVTPTGNISSTNVQDALEELQDDIDVNVTNILDNTTDISDNTNDINNNGNSISTNTNGITTNAASIGTNASSIAANATDIADNTTDITALQVNNHVDDDVETVTGTAVDNTDIRNPIINTPTASEVAVTPTGNLAANNVQDALVELQTDIDGNSTDIAALQINNHADDDVESVTGIGVDNTDPRNPVINIPQTTSDITNDSGFITANDVPPETVTNFGNTNAVLNYVNEDGTAQDVDLNFLRSPWDNADGTAANQSSTTINYPNKVSIGQSPTPVASLDIDTGDNTYINVKRNGVRVAYLGDTGTANAGILHLYNTTGNENVRISGSTSSVNNASYVNRYSGDFGVGTNAPIEKLQVVGNVSANAYLITSDKRLKYDFVQDGTKVINGNKVALYRYKRTYDGKDEFGVIAQDVYTALDGKQQETKDLIIKKNVGVDHNATLEAINDKHGVKATNLLEAYELALDQVVKDDLEKNGFPTINRVDAIAEFTKLSEFEPTEKKTLSDKKIDRLERFKKVDFSGQTTYQTFNVNITNLHSINTTALNWL